MVHVRSCQCNDPSLTLRAIPECIVGIRQIQHKMRSTVRTVHLCHPAQQGRGRGGRQKRSRSSGSNKGGQHCGTSPFSIPATDGPLHLAKLSFGLCDYYWPIGKTVARQGTGTSLPQGKLKLGGTPQFRHH
jgi:hypothetical protein